MLLNNRWFGTALRQWEEDRSITRASRLKAMILIIFTFALSVTISHGKLPLQLGLLAIGCILLFFMWRLKATESVVPVPIIDDSR